MSPLQYPEDYLCHLRKPNLPSPMLTRWRTPAPTKKKTDRVRLARPAKQGCRCVAKNRICTRAITNKHRQQPFLLEPIRVFTWDQKSDLGCRSTGLVCSASRKWQKINLAMVGTKNRQRRPLLTPILPQFPNQQVFSIKMFAFLLSNLRSGREIFSWRFFLWIHMYKCTKIFWNLFYTWQWCQLPFLPRRTQRQKPAKAVNRRRPPPRPS